jgi:hypothetical protein
MARSRIASCSRGLRRARPRPLLRERLPAAVAFTIAVVVGAVWLIRRTVPATRQGFHAEISAPMLGVVAALFGLLLAFVIITAYENFIEAGADVNREADSLASMCATAPRSRRRTVSACAARREPTCERSSTRNGG